MGTHSNSLNDSTSIQNWCKLMYMQHSKSTQSRFESTSNMFCLSFNSKNPFEIHSKVIQNVFKLDSITIDIIDIHLTFKHFKWLFKLHLKRFQITFNYYSKYIQTWFISITFELFSKGITYNSTRYSIQCPFKANLSRL